MTKRIVANTTITPVAVADAVNFTDNQYLWALQGGSSSQRNRIWEIYLGGQAGSSTPTLMILGRDSTVGTAHTLGTGQSDTAIEVLSAPLAAPPLVGNVTTAKPQRSATLHLMNLSFNAFGGVIRWVAAPEEVIDSYGTAVNIGETSLSAFTGGTPGAMGAHMIYETT